ncbi:hypothetical protein L0156_08085, partial [bacterium]|nr:hypothetical protein [bacterium]
SKEGFGFCEVLSVFCLNHWIQRERAFKIFYSFAAVYENWTIEYRTLFVMLPSDVILKMT